MAFWNKRNATAEAASEGLLERSDAPEAESPPVRPEAAPPEPVGADVTGSPASTAEAPAPVDRASSGVVAGDLDPAELERRRTGLEDLLELMRPAVQMDGGDLALVAVDFEAGIVEVELQGSCGTCAISTTTLKGGIERLMFERLDWVREVRGGVDEEVDPLESAAMGRGAYVPRYY